MVYHVNADDLVGTSVQTIEPKSKYKRIVAAKASRSQRMFDIAAASVLLVFFAPFILIVTLCVMASDRRQILFAHTRIGLGGRTFKCLKFRTMCLDAETRLKKHLAENPEAQKEWDSCQKLTHDPRLTPIGAVLRKTSLDELPQLWNVLVGEMSMVGPRPIVADEAKHYGTNYAAYKSVRPGLTGAWQVSGRSETTYVERVALDVEYVENRSLWLDFVICLKTVRVVLIGKGAR